MSCQDIAELLDDRGFDALDAEARSRTVAHLESCADCRRDRELHARLIARRIPPMPADLAADCRELVVSGPHAGRGQRARSRLILIGTVAAVAAAAAMLVLYLWPSAGTLEQSAQSAEASAMPVSGDTMPVGVATADAQQDVDAQGPSGPAFLVFVHPLVDPESVAANLKDDPMAGLYEHVRAIESNPVRRSAMASFRAALINELILIPGLGIVDSESQLTAATPSVPGFNLRVGGSYQTSRAGQFVTPDARYVAVNVSAWRLQADGKAALMPNSFGANIDMQGECRTSAAGVITCGDAQSQAASVVRQLRERLFPPDPLITRQRQARLLNATLEPALRFSALEELLGIQRGGATQAAALRDPATLRGLLDLAATGDPALRARIWRSIRGVADPDLLQPLQAAAVSDADEPRLEAVATLAADFAQDPRGRATLESVANTDRRALVRAVAERGLSGEAGWRAYVNASMQDTERPAAERVEAFTYQFNLPTHQQPQGTGQTYPAFSMLDEAGVDVLARLLPQASNEQPASEGRMVRIANAMAPRYRSNAAVTDALLHYLRNGKSTNTRMVAAQVLGFTRRDDERVRTAMRESLRSDPDPEVRDLVREMMGEGVAASSP